MSLFVAAPLLVALGFALCVFVLRNNPWLLTKFIGYANIAAAAASTVTKKL